MRKVDYVSVPVVTSKQGYFKEFYSKMIVIPQGFCFEDIVIKPVIDDNVVRFGYGGAFIPGRRDPKELLTFLTSLDESILFEFYIFTHQPQWVEPFTHDSRN